MFRRFSLSTAAVCSAARQAGTAPDEFIEKLARRKDGPKPTPVPHRRPDFSNVQNAYKHMTTMELVRSLVVLKMCRIGIIRDHGAKMLAAVHKILGERLTYNTFVRWTMYKHFCGGENDKEVKQVMGRLGKAGVGSILDYAAEADIEPSQGSHSKIPPKMDIHITETNIPYVAKDEELFDANMKLYCMSVTQASLNDASGSWAACALKVTAFCDPILLSRASAVDLNVRKVWGAIIGLSTAAPLEEYRVVINMDKDDQRYATVAQMKSYIAASNAKMTEGQMAEFMLRMDPQSTGKIDYFHYTRIVSDGLLPAQDVLAPLPADLAAFLAPFPQLTEVERHLWNVMVGRINAVLTLARELKVRVMIDAEHTFYQTAIDHVTRTMQRRYNTSRPVVYGTYQCYLQFTLERLRNDMTRAKKGGWCWAGKVVRGAYMEQERALAASNGYTCSIYPSIEGTHKCYNDAAAFILEQMQQEPEKPFAVLFGTHNQSSLEIITKAMNTMKPNQGEIAFAELYGMADHLTMPLSQAGYKTYKYVPYGPVRETINYLSRRAVENGSIMSGSLDVPKLQAELKSRLFPSSRSTQ